MKKFVLGFVFLSSLKSFASYKCPSFPSTPHLAPMKMALEFSKDQNHAVLTITTFEGQVKKTTEVLPKAQQEVDGAIYSNSDFSITAGFGNLIQLTNLRTNESVICK